MRFLSWLITLPIIVVFVVFALHNREEVMLNFWPFDVQVGMSLSFLTLGVLFLGFVLGSVLPVVKIVRLKFQRHMLQRKVDKLTTQLSQQKAKNLEEQEPTFLHQERYQMISDTKERKLK